MRAVGGSVAELYFGVSVGKQSRHRLRSCAGASAELVDARSTRS